MRSIGACLRLTLLGLWAVGFALSARPVSAGRPLATDCSAITLRLQPGLNPKPSNSFPMSVAPDIPRGPFQVPLPLYPGAKMLKRILRDPRSSAWYDPSML